jgi:hypothetical protein
MGYFCCIPGLASLFGLRSNNGHYCDRCRRFFPSIAALQQHIDNSPEHHICYKCNFDGVTADSLTEHQCASGHQEMDYGSIRRASPRAYTGNQKGRDVCSTCHLELSTESNLSTVCLLYLRLEACNNAISTA